MSATPPMYHSDDSNEPFQERRPLVSSLNANITCQICRGYLVDATAITECGHLFCRSCIVSHLCRSLPATCPVLMCDVSIHKSNPFKCIMRDPQMQDLVNKVVPQLVQNERQRKKDYYKSINKEDPDDDNTNQGSDAQGATESNESKKVNHPVIGVELVARNEDTEQIDLRYLRVSSNATISHIQKFLSAKLSSEDDPKTFDVYFKDELLGKYHSLMFIYRSRGRLTTGPLLLHYQLNTRV